ncbi:hypothetical protein KZ686_11775 [Cupriavidus cauae]|uniref:Uncharacterized protein n=1 Tax=Cupriavidus cauae TaxID=2608999 RepID=A0A5M8AG63_9BURK|nr:hypothetical protein [Cupriavidus cauae]KAA0178625.1 hypothetical protein FX016_24090 [Cupriavidus gilardii]KAA6119864.1 hypothetical protein F1599_18355 [Cupriavidus cauae]UZN48456.1 hypothetical protein KZ686_11775 [Cupriavidus cauae]
MLGNMACPLSRGPLALVIERHFLGRPAIFTALYRGLAPDPARGADVTAFPAMAQGLLGVIGFRSIPLPLTPSRETNMSDGKLGIAGTTFIAFAVAGVALAASLYLAYLAAPPKGRALIRDVLDHDSGSGPQG